MAETLQMYQEGCLIHANSLLQRTLVARAGELRAAAKELEAGLAQAMPGVASIHQLPSMTPNSDYAGEQAQNMAYIMQTAEGKIIVIDGGVQTESGTHNELLNNKGIYNEFWNQQMNHEEE